MDLSKIPEPSAEDLSDASWLLFRYSPGMSGKLRVIAHVLRHGRVLAAFATNVIEMPHAIWESDLTEDERAAIEFFEKFGGNDER